MSDSAGVIRDFLLKLGFDASAVYQGLRKVESKLNSLSTKQEQLNASGSKKFLDLKEREVAALERTNLLSEQRLLDARQKAIKTAEDRQIAANEKVVKAKEKAEKAAQDKSEKLLLRESRKQEAIKLAELKRSERNRIYSEKATARKLNSLKSFESSKQGFISNIRNARELQLHKTGNVYKGDDLKSEAARISGQYEGLIRRAEVAKDIHEIKSLRGEFQALGTDINIARAHQTKLNNQISMSSRIGRRAVGNVGGGAFGGALGAAIGPALTNPIIALGAAVGVATVALAKMSMQMQSLKMSMVASSGSMMQAGKDMEYVKGVALKYGIGLQEAAKGFSKINVASRLAGLTMEQTKEIFMAGTEASVAFGLSSEEVGGVFKAFSDMLSKGTVSAEEIKGQLGDRLPFAVGVASKALGVTTQELMKMMEQGKIMANDLLPKMAVEMRKMANEGGGVEKGIKTASRAIGSMGAAWDIAMGNLGEGGFDSGLAEMFDSITNFLLSTSEEWQFIGFVFGKIFDLIAGIFRIATIAFRALMAPFKLIYKLFTDPAVDEFGNSIRKWGTLGQGVVRVFDIIIGSIKYAIGMTERFLNYLNSVSFEQMGKDLGGVVSDAFDVSKHWENWKNETTSWKLQMTNGVPSNTSATNVTNPSTSNAQVVKNVKVESKPVININGGNTDEIKKQIDSMFQNEYITGMYAN